MQQQQQPDSCSRHSCPQCGRNRGPYCEDCVLILEQSATPQLRLPIKVDIVQHGETNARSTALHAALLAPLDATIYRHPGSRTSRRCDLLDLPLPAYDAATTVVLFPEEGADVVGRCAPFERVVVLESSWKKARGLLHHPRLAPLRLVALPPEACAPSQFAWRRGDGGFKGAVEEGLSSIEAIYQCCRLVGGPDQSFDGLLHYFSRTKEIVDARGPLPTSRQEARERQAREKQQRQGERQQQRREEQQQRQQEERQRQQQEERQRHPAAGAEAAEGGGGVGNLGQE